MTDSVKEQLSACLDGELPPAELALLLKRVERDAGTGAGESMGWYALIREALKADQPVMASSGFAAKVMAALEHEAPVARSALQISPVAMRRLRPAAGLAIAAGVAAVAVLSVQHIGVAPEMVATYRLANNEPASVPAPVSTEDSPSYVVPTTTSNAVFVPATRLTNYVVAHSEYSSPLGRRSVLTGVLADDDDDADPDSDPPAGAEDPAVAGPQPQER